MEPEHSNELPARADEYFPFFPLGWYARAGLPALLLLVTTVFLVSALDPFSPVKSMILRLYSTGGILLLLHSCLKAGAVRRVRTPLDIPLLAIVGWTGASFVYAVNRYAVFDWWIDLLCGVFLFYAVVLACSARGTEAVRRILGWALLPVFVIAPMGALDLANVSFFPWDSLLSLKRFSVMSLLGMGDVMPASWLHNFDGRASATFGNPVYLAGWLIMLIPVAWVLFAESKRAAGKIYYLAALLLLEFTLVATFTRSAWICAVISLVLLWALSRGTGTSRSGGHLGLAVLLAVTVLLAGVFLVRRGGINPSQFGIGERILSLANTMDASRMQRVLIWKTAWEMIKAHPLFGVGLGNYSVFHAYFQKPFFESPVWGPIVSFPERVHNEFLDIWAEMGIVGLAVFLIAIVMVVAVGLRAVRRRGEEGRLAAGLMAGGAGMLLYGMFQFPLHVLEIQVYTWLFAGLLVVLSGSGAVGERVRLWRPARARESALLGVVLLFLFFMAAGTLARPVAGNICFFQAVRNAETAPSGKTIEDMLRGISFSPGNMEMSVRFGMTANALASRESKPEDRIAISRMARDESLRGLKLFPYESRLHANLGTALIRLNDPARGIAAFREAVSLDPTNVNSFYNLGIAYYKTRNYNNSIANYKRAIFNYKREIFDFMTSNYNSAISIESNYERAINLVPDVKGIYHNLGLAYLKAGRIEDAAGAFEEGLSRGGSPDNDDLLNSLGAAYARLGRRGDAISCFRRALADDPGNDNARGNLAIQWIESGEYERAVEELEKVIARDPGSGLAHYQLGRAYHLMGLREKAIGELSAAARLMRDPREAEKLLKTVRGGNPN